MSGGCHSLIGYNNKPQALNLDRGCYDMGVIVHEILHGELNGKNMSQSASIYQN